LLKEAYATSKTTINYSLYPKILLVVGASEITKEEKK